MSGRAPFTRMLALAFAILQLVSPTLVVIADGSSIRDAVAESIAHVESTSSDNCPRVHAPDCALCRYLSGTTASLSDASIVLPCAGRVATLTDISGLPRATTTLLPHGRAPPLG